MDCTEQTADLGEVDIYVRRHGRPDLPVLLAIHGGPSWDHSYLLPAVAELADVRHVVLFDLRGCGRSSRDLPLEAYQPERCIDDLHLLIRWLGVEQVDLLGFSYGGQLAMLFLERHTAQVGRLILASTTAYPGIEQYLRESPEYRRRYAGIDLEPLFADPSLDDEEKTRRMAMLTAPLMLWDLDRLDELRAVLTRVRFSGDWMAPWRAGTLRPPRPADPERVLREAAKPTLILHGDGDLGFPVQVAHRLHDAVPHSELAVIDRAGHQAQFEQPTEWIGHIRAFLTTTPVEHPTVVPG